VLKSRVITTAFVRFVYWKVVGLFTVTPAFLMVAVIEHQQYSNPTVVAGLMLKENVVKSGTVWFGRVAGMTV
jgi:hypothetical protein